MTNQQYNAMAGHIQGLIDIVFTLVVALDNKKLINTTAFIGDLKGISVNHLPSLEQESAQVLLTHFAGLVSDLKEMRAAEEFAQSIQQ